MTMRSDFIRLIMHSYHISHNYSVNTYSVDWFNLEYLTNQIHMGFSALSLE